MTVLIAFLSELLETDRVLPPAEDGTALPPVVESALPPMVESALPPMVESSTALPPVVGTTAVNTTLSTVALPPPVEDHRWEGWWPVRPSILTVRSAHLPSAHLPVEEKENIPVEDNTRRTQDSCVRRVLSSTGMFL